MTLHANLVDRDRVGGEAVRNVNPANTAEVVGEYRAFAADADAAIAAARAGICTIRSSTRLASSATARPGW